MKLARLIITFREDLIEELRRFYLDEKRTAFLVLACNKESIDISKFKEKDNFHLVYYFGPGPRGSISGLQYHVWLDVLKQFAGFDGWVIHDYDLVCQPTDQEIFSRLKADEYGMIGRAFPVWQPGMGRTDIDTYPFPQGHDYWCVDRRGGQANSSREDQVRKLLLDKFPTYFKNTKTFFGGYGDFLAATTDKLKLLEIPEIRAIKNGGVEQIVHSVLAAHNFSAVDMRRFYKMKIKLDGRYLAPKLLFSDYELLHPLKFWPNAGRQPTFRDSIQNKKRILKTFIKRIIGYEGWHEW